MQVFFLIYSLDKYIITDISIDTGGDTMDEFIKKIEDFLNKTKMSATTLGLKATKNPNFIFRIRSGAQCLDSTKEKVLNFINSYKEK